MVLTRIIDEVHDMGHKQSQHRGAVNEHGGYKGRHLVVEEAIRAKAGADNNISEKVGGPKELRKGRKENVQF